MIDAKERKEIEKRLDDNFYWYLANQNDLVKKHNGKHLVIVDKQVVGEYDKRIDAYYAGAKNYGLGFFSIQRCSPGDTDTVIPYYGPWFTVQPLAA